MTSLQRLLRHNPLAALLQADDEAIPYFVGRDFLGEDVASIEAVWAISVKLPNPS